MRACPNTSETQRSLGDVFEQLERIGAFGRERCRGYGYGPISPALRVHRDEAIKLINLADLALSYARVHLTYLEPAPLDGGVVTDALDENTSPAP